MTHYRLAMVKDFNVKMEAKRTYKIVALETDVLEVSTNSFKNFLSFLQPLLQDQNCLIEMKMFMLNLSYKGKINSGGKVKRLHMWGQP